MFQSKEVNIMDTVVHKKFINRESHRKIAYHLARKMDPPTMDIVS